MIYILINLAAITIATVGGLAVGAGFYLLFDKAGSKLRAIGRTGFLKFAILAFLAHLWLASILAGALILAPNEADPSIMALGSAVVIWIGFVAPVIIVTHLYRGLPLRTAMLDCAYWLLVMFVQAVLLSAIGLDPPPVA